VQLPESDPDSFRQLDQVWSRDASRVFYSNRGIVPRDIDSFEILVGGWARDRVAVYYENREITQAHRDSFEVLDKWCDFGRDSDHVFWKGWRVESADPKTFVGVRPNEGHDHKTKFYCILKDERNYGPQFRDNEKLEVLTKPVEAATTEKRP
jgi:hypothetical protein